MAEPLPGIHHAEVDVRGDLELGEHLPEQLPVLAARDDHRLGAGRPPQLADHGGELDHLRARPEDGYDFHGAAASSATRRVFVQPARPPISRNQASRDAIAHMYT